MCEKEGIHTMYLRLRPNYMLSQRQEQKQDITILAQIPTHGQARMHAITNAPTRACAHAKTYKRTHTRIYLCPLWLTWHQTICRNSAAFWSFGDQKMPYISLILAGRN